MHSLDYDKILNSTLKEGFYEFYYDKYDKDPPIDKLNISWMQSYLGC